MDRQAVRSSSIRSIGYDAASEILEVEFHDGGIYQYFGVSEFLYQGIMLAKSKGEYFNHRLAGRFRFEHLRAPS